MSARRALTARFGGLLALLLASAMVLADALTAPRPEAAPDRPPAAAGGATVSDTGSAAPRRPARPEVIKAIYLTSWSAATPARVARALDLIERTELNAVVIDVKDYTGNVVFRTGDPLVARMGSEIPRLDLAALVRTFHERAIYVVVRIAAFQDHHLATARPDLAVRDAAGRLWRDRQGLGWVDPASGEVWAYLAAVGKAAAAAGADELNFDYLRFPSDGDLEGLRYPFFDPWTGSRRRTIRRFFEVLTGALRPTGAVLSADLFGLVTVTDHDLGIGQVLEDALLYFDYVAPMVYPSHYARGFLTFRNPAAHPYEVVHYSMRTAEERRRRFAHLVSALTAETAADASDRETAPVLARLRPWLQAFDLGAPYPPPAVRAQIRAVYDAGGSSGWYLWSPLNTYDQEALRTEAAADGSRPARR
ncbi:MAG: putative glycoside hydrolase [Armatimonadota bacterium]|nr:putative glycoside hydrolase [Armatimonadota bacterium]